MGLSITDPKPCCRSGRLWARLTVWLAICIASLGMAASASAASSQAEAAAKNPDKLYIDADQLTYDKDHNTVSASGGVVLYYKSKTLQADHVVYDRAAKRVRADGHTKFTDEKGDVTYAPRFDMTDDFANGFADSVRTITTDNTRLASPRIERSAGSVTVLEQGVYTACEPCKQHPEIPPLWQVRAAKIIENQQTHTIYFENAWLDIYGVPVAYIPYLSAPDPTVTRQSGVLAPVYTNTSALGTGVSVPYYLNLAPNYDLTLTPSYYSSQGPAADVLWRQRLDHGEYSVQLSGINQLNPGNFLPAPYGAGNLTFRGAAQSEGKFYINDKWQFGWDLTALSDRFYLTDYRLAALDSSTFFFQDIVSSIYLRGQYDRGFFDLSAYHFQTTTGYVDQRQDPSIAPTLDYHRTFAVDPNQSGGIGGEATVELNAASVNRTEALYQSVGAPELDKAYSLYSVCEIGGATTYAAYAPGNCLLRGIAGDYSRATAQASWDRKFVDPLGEVWKPFVFARLTGETTSLATSQVYSYGGVSEIYNSAQPAFFNGASAGSAATGMPGIGLEYRYPFVFNSAMGSQIIETIGQVIVRPNETIPRIQPNEDAQSLVFDETNLFAWDKYSGYDRVEGGTRVNYGLQYTDSFADGGHANIVGGQSIQAAGQNSYTIADDANTGLESGLDKKYSNYVIGETVQPFSTPISFTSKQQLDSASGALQRFDGIISAKSGGLTASLDYGRYAPQPLLGWDYEREGIMASAAYKAPNGLSIDSSVVFDVSRHYYNTAATQTSRFYPTNYHFGVGYFVNDCATFKVSYTSVMSQPISTTVGVAAAPATRDQTILFEIDLRTLGDIKSSTGVN